MIDTVCEIMVILLKVYISTVSYLIIGLIRLGLWTENDWKAWVINKIKSENFYVFGLYNVALIRYKPVTIYVVYTNKKKHKEIKLKEHSMSLLMTKCCNTYGVSLKKLGNVHLVDSNGNAVVETKWLVNRQKYTLVVS